MLELERSSLCEQIEVLHSDKKNLHEELRQALLDQSSFTADTRSLDQSPRKVAVAMETNGEEVGERDGMLSLSNERRESVESGLGTYSWCTLYRNNLYYL